MNLIERISGLLDERAAKWLRIIATQVIYRCPHGRNPQGKCMDCESDAKFLRDVANAAPAIRDALAAAKELCKVIENGNIRYVNETLEYEALRSKLAALEEL